MTDISRLDSAIGLVEYLTLRPRDRDSKRSI